MNIFDIVWRARIEYVKKEKRSPTSIIISSGVGKLICDELNKNIENDDYEIVPLQLLSNDIYGMKVLWANTDAVIYIDFS